MRPDDSRLSPKTPLSSHLPPLRAVQVFDALGRCGSVRGAARELQVSSGAVTQQVQSLERFLGVRLVQREKRGIKLTAMGISYHGYATAAMEQLRRGGQNLEQLRRSKQLLVSALPSFTSKWLGPLVLDWRLRHPEVNLVLDGTDSEPSLEDGEADFRISYGARNNLHTRYVELFHDHVVPVCSPALLKRVRRPLEPCDVLRFPMLNVEWGLEIPHWSDWLLRYAASTKVSGAQISFSLASASIDAAIEGRGIVLAQYSMAARALADGSLTRPFGDLTIPLPEPYFLAWSLAAREKPLGADFYSWLTQRTRIDA
jgi:LysR family transcriptional regulator, glycine cleavage system transcriptional activator